METCPIDDAKSGAIETVTHPRLRRLAVSTLANELTPEQFDRLGGSVPETTDFRALLCSHLGHQPERHALIARYICRSVLEAKHTGETLLVAAGMAIEPWVLRAAELFDVPAVVLVGREEQSVFRRSKLRFRLSTHHRIHKIELDGITNENRDSLVALLADRIDGVFVRSRGRVLHAIGERLRVDEATRVRVAVHPSLVKETGRSLRSLMDLGAVGWYCHSFRDRAMALRKPLVRGEDRSTSMDESWECSKDEWLIHCTRQSAGPWPGQSQENYRDEMLLGETSAVERSRSALGSLHRILRMRRLIGSNTASCADYPVVCFTNSSLIDALARRTFRQHLHRWDCEPYGIAIRKSAAIEVGIKPVIYGDTRKEAARLGVDAYRFQARGNTFDWTRENEWRVLGDVNLASLSPSDVRVFVRHPSEKGLLPVGYSTIAVEA